MRKQTVKVLLWMAVIAAVVWMVPKKAEAGAANFGSVTLTSETGQVAVSTNCATATQILSQSSFIGHNVIVNNSSWTVLLISTSSSNLSPSSSFYLPASSSFTPDGPADAYNGPMWACSTATVTNVQSFSVPKVGVFRAR